MNFAFQPKKENRNPLSNTQLQPSCVTPVRNPFKVVGQKEKDHERKNSQPAEGDMEREEQDSESDPQEAGGRKSRQKENTRKEASEVETESSSMASDTYRGKQLPAGMKVKKRLSDEERPKGNGARNGTEKVKAKSRESSSRTDEDKSIPASNIEPVRPEKTRPAVQDPPKDKDHPIKDSKTTEDQTSECQQQSTESSRAKNRQEDDDDEVVLVSVKPAPVKSPPVSAVQKTLTAFPGFQPASSVKSQQEDPRGLHNLLSAQLKQKKVSVFIFVLFFASLGPNRCHF